MIKTRIAAIAALVLVTACEGLKEAMTAHVDVVARAEDQELSVQHLADLLGKAQFPLAKPVVEQVSEVWISYQLLAKAAAEGDSLADSALIDRVMWPVYSQSKTGKWMERVQASFAVDTSSAAAEAASTRVASSSRPSTSSLRCPLARRRREATPSCAAPNVSDSR